MPFITDVFTPDVVPALPDSPQCFDATVVAINPTYVVCPSYSSTLRWGPCSPAGKVVKIGDSVGVLISEAGTVWLVA